MTALDAPRRVFLAVGGVLVLGALAALGWALPALGPEETPLPAYAVLAAVPLLVLGTCLLLNAAGEGASSESRAPGSASWSIATTTPAPAIACWVGALVLVGVVLTHLAAFGPTTSVVALVAAGFMVNWGRLALQAWRRTRG